MTHKFNCGFFSVSLLSKNIFAHFEEKLKSFWSFWVSILVIWNKVRWCQTQHTSLNFRFTNTRMYATVTKVTSTQSLSDQDQFFKEAWERKKRDNCIIFKLVINSVQHVKIISTLQPHTAWRRFWVTFPWHSICVQK